MKRFVIGGLLFVAFVLLPLCFYIHNSGIETYPLRPRSDIPHEAHKLYCCLREGVNGEVDWHQLDGTLEYIGQEYDCSDFRLVPLIRILYEYGDLMPEDIRGKVESVLADFRFWWDDEGRNSMCYWSENHQILFSSAEYLIGNYYPEMYFSKAGMLGQELSLRGKERVMCWLDLRWKYGFSEYCSNVYYKEDIAALVNLIEYSPDLLLRERAKIILDLLLYDLAVNSYGRNVTSASSRAYRWNRKANSFDDIFNKLDRGVVDFDNELLYGLYSTDQYEIPPVLLSVARDRSECEVMQSNGIDVSELDEEQLLGQEERQLMMQWGMEAFVNPEVVRNTVLALNNKRMFSNAFLADMKWLNVPFFRNSDMLVRLVEYLKPYQLGTALQKASSYTYRNEWYTMYTTQSYHPGEPADQQHVFGVNMGEDCSVYHTHPAADENSGQQSPNFWVGYGRLPHSVQDKNINMSIYSIPEKRTFMESDLLDYTYLMIPYEKLDTVIVSERYVWLKRGGTYGAFIGSGLLEQKMVDGEWLVLQRGKEQAWITEMGSAEDDGSFEDFMSRISGNSCEFDSVNRILAYGARGKEYVLIFDEGLYVDGTIVDTDYDGYDSPYLRCSREESNRQIVFGSDTLDLNYHDAWRSWPDQASHRVSDNKPD